MIEWMAHSAIHGNPGLRFQGFDNFKIYSRLDIGESDEVTVRLKAAKMRKCDDGFVVPIQLCRVAHENEIVHAAADILLCSRYQVGVSTIKEPELNDYPNKNDIYSDDRLFHGLGFHAIEKIDGYSKEGMVAHAKAAPPPADWIEQPLRQKWLADPLIIDSSFQMMILWSIEEDNVPSLPVSAGSYRQFQSDFPGDGIRIVIRVTEKVASSIHADIEFQDSRGQIIARMEDYCCIQDKSLFQAFGRNKLKTAVA